MHPLGAVMVTVPKVLPLVAEIVIVLFSATLIASLALPSTVALPKIVPAVAVVHNTEIVPTPSSSVMFKDSVPVKV